MSPGIRRSCSVALVAMLLAQPAAAVLPDPVEAGLLARIAAALKAIEELRLRLQERFQNQVLNRLESYAFPERVLDPIRAGATAVLDVRKELQRLACDWPMSTRLGGLRDLLTERTTWCRVQHHAVWGSHDGLWDGPLQEAHDYVASMTNNMLSDRAEKTSSSWVRAHRDLFSGYALRWRSPGEANRAEAAALAWANQVALGNADILTHQLLVRQMARDLDRYDRKKAADLAYYAYGSVSSLSGREWRQAPPDPSDRP